MKKSLSYVLIVLALIITAVLSGCTSSKYKSLTDFERLEDLDTQRVTRIWVTNEETGDSFAIKEPAQISHIMKGLTARKAFVKQETPAECGNILLMFFNADDCLDSIYVYNIQDGEESYELADKELLKYILNCENKQYKSLSDFSRFKDKDLNTVTKIKVSWSSAGGPTFTEFFIEGEKAEFLMKKMTDAKAFVSHDGFYYGNNDSLAFYAGEDVLGAIGFVNIRDGEGENEQLYKFSTSEVPDYIKNYMKENGLK